MKKTTILFTLPLATVKPSIINAEEINMPNRHKPSVEELKKRLTPEQFNVTQNEGTEKPYKNAYWDNHEPGIYVDIVSGEPLFSSTDKFDSGTGWPSFARPIAKENIVEKIDRNIFFGTRTEVHSKSVHSHLGHVFNDGPAPTGLRYCINSASLRFVPIEKLKEDGYEKYLKLFSESGAHKEKATFAGGCFWCMVSPFAKQPGILRVVSGYTGGKKVNPTYNEVSSGVTGHIESIQVTYDPSIISYDRLLEIYWKNIDPTDAGGQFCDRGDQYKSIIFYQSESQKKTATEARALLNKDVHLIGKPIVTEIRAASDFYPAEEYHQDYYKKNHLKSDW